MKMRAFLLRVHMNNQQWQKTFEMGGGEREGGGGGANDSCVCVSKQGLRVWSPRKSLQIRCSEIASETTFGLKRHYRKTA